MTAHHGRLERLEASAQHQPPSDAERLTADQEAALKMIGDFAANAKHNEHLDEFEALFACAEEVADGVPLGHRWRWLREARPAAQLPPCPSWPTPDQIAASEQRLAAMMRAGDAEPDGGFGYVDLAVSLSEGDKEPGPTDDLQQRWLVLVGRRLRRQRTHAEAAV